LARGPDAPKCSTPSKMFPFCSAPRTNHDFISPGARRRAAALPVWCLEGLEADCPRLRRSSAGERSTAPFVLRGAAARYNRPPAHGGDRGPPRVDGTSLVAPLYLAVSLSLAKQLTPRPSRPTPPWRLVRSAAAHPVVAEVVHRTPRTPGARHDFIQQEVTHARRLAARRSSRCPPRGHSRPRGCWTTPGPDGSAT